ncbi:MAG: MFS transporter [Chloroflexaceae bacterium]|nr:MFS transporter [Chloroflexaceae bacterium]
MPASPHPTTATHAPGVLVGLAYAAFVSLGLPDGLTGVAWPSLRATFGLPLDALGALIATTTLGYLAASFSSGPVLARLGTGWLLVVSCLMTAFSLIGFGLAPVWATMVGLGLLAGLGAGAIDAGLNTYAAEHFTPRTVNWLHAAFGLGAASGPLIMTAAIGLAGSWRPGYLFVGVAQLALAGCFAVTRTWWGPRRPQTTAATRQDAAMLHTLGLPAVWLSMLLFFLYTGLEVSAGQWLYSLLTETRGVAPALAGIWVSIYWGSLTLGRVLAGAMVGRIGMRRLLWMCMGGALLGVTLLWLNLAPWLALAGLALLGLALAPMFPLFIALTPARMGSAHVANTVGFQIAAAMLGGAGLAGGFGIIAGRHGLETLEPFLFGTALLLIGVFLVLDRHPHAPTPGA